MARLSLVLHAHLPWVRHPEHADALEEDWLYEALSETYLPLYQVARGWMQAGLQGRIALSFSPPLLEMLADPLLQRRYRARLERLLSIAAAQVQEAAPDRRPIARFYEERWASLRSTWDELGGDLLGAYAQLDRASVLELFTSAATHAFLPFFLDAPGVVRAQLEQAVATFSRAFGRRPAGLWLPECGYAPSLDRAVAAAGFSWTFLDTHGVLGAEPAPLYGAALPVVSPAGVTFFGRDPSSARQVWSADLGYPGDPRYREFHRDAGWELRPDQLNGLILGDGTRRSIGLKYHRITDRRGRLEDKQLYDRDAALQVVEEHARHFVLQRREESAAWAKDHQREPWPAALYDAELFGHWWFEGPEWLDRVVRAAEGHLRLVTPSQGLAGDEAFQVAEPAQSSWGEHGYGAVWLNDKNAWIWPPLHDAAARLGRLAARPGPRGDLERRALAQLTREFFLAAASDWPFILSAGTMVPYAERRIRQHLSRFVELAAALESGSITVEALRALEAETPLFPELDPAWLEVRR